MSSLSVYMYVYHMYIPGSVIEVRRGCQDSLELKSPIVVSHHVGMRNP